MPQHPPHSFHNDETDPDDQRAQGFGRRHYDYRFEVLERAADQAWETAGEVGILTQRVETLEKNVDAMLKAVDSLRRTLVTFAISVAGSAVIFALGIAKLTN